MRRAALLLLALGCSRSSEAPKPAPTASPPSTATAAITAPPVAPPAVTAPTAGSAEPASAEAAPWESDVLVSAKPIGHTSVVFKLRFKSGKTAAFKPTSRRGGGRYRGEVAARRLAQALGIADRVPPAHVVLLPGGALRAALGEAAKLYDDEVLADKAGNVQGALIPWIDKLTFPPFERDPWVARWKGWLGAGDLPKGPDAALAASFSTLVMFDYLTANFDRFSGGNIGQTDQGILFIDNDGAFLPAIHPEAQKKNEERLLATRRFSRSFVSHLRELRDFPLGLAAVFGLDREGAPLLAPQVVEGVRARLDKVLAHVDQARTAADSVDVEPFE